VAAPVYSFLLFQQQGVSSSTVAFTVPSSEVWVVRSIDCYVGAALLGAALLFNDLPSGGTWLRFEELEALARSFTWTGRQVFPPGSGLEVVPENHAWDVRVSGYHFAAPA